MLQHAGIQITWLGHDGFKLKKDRVIYVDPFHLGPKSEPADTVFVTHEHLDHFSLDDLKKIVTLGTTVVTIAACEKAAKGLKPKAVRVVAPGDRFEVDGVEVEVLPAYNTTKFRSPGNPFHPKADGKVGFILGIGGVRVYHTGDTDEIPEMSRAKGVDVLLLPVSGTYVMTAQEAAKACDAIQPKLAIPMHYGTIVGSVVDAENFRKSVKCSVAVAVLQAEP